MTDFKPGDIVTGTHDDGSTMSERKVTCIGIDGVPGINVPAMGYAYALEWLGKHGWHFTLVKRPTPLPEEPGVYISGKHLPPWDVTTTAASLDGDICPPLVRVNDERGWFCNGMHLSETKVAGYMPLHRLARRDDVIREVADWLYRERSILSANDVRDHFLGGEA